MKKLDKENYIFEKKALLIQLFIFYYSNVRYDNVVLRSFGFEFDPTCNYKSIVISKKGNLHKYTTHIYTSLFSVNYYQLDVMGNVNVFKVNDIYSNDLYKPNASLNIYFDDIHIFVCGFLEGEKVEFYINNKKSNKSWDFLYLLFNDKKYLNINETAKSFVEWLMKLYTNKLNVDLVLGAGINQDYGAKTWSGMIKSLNNDFYKGDSKFSSEIESYVGQELFTSSMILQTSGFDPYQSLNRELYLFEKKKDFSDPCSTLYGCMEYIKNHESTSVITYNYDTNLEYLLKKNDVLYNVVYDDNSFIDKTSKANIFHVHGLLPYNKFNEKKYTDSIILNESEYYYLYNNPYSWNIAKQLHDFKYNTCIFIGISLTDPDMKRLLELAKNYLKFNFIFLRKNNEYNQDVYKELSLYFFTFDLIAIWIDDYSEIDQYLKVL